MKIVWEEYDIKGGMKISPRVEKWEKWSHMLIHDQNKHQFCIVNIVSGILIVNFLSRTQMAAFLNDNHYAPHDVS